MSQSSQRGVSDGGKDAGGPQSLVMALVTVERLRAGKVAVQPTVNGVVSAVEYFDDHEAALQRVRTWLLEGK